MKQLIASLVLLFTLSTYSYSQVIINQSIVEEPPYSVGDTITIRYSVSSNSQLAYLWFRQQYSNKHLRYVPNSTVFTQGSNVQTFFTEWVNFIFNPNPTIGVGELYNQYLSTPWNYVENPDWNVQQFTLQKSGNSISGNVLDQKYVILDNTNYQYIHKLHLAFAENNSGVKISPIGSVVLWLSIDGPISGGSSTFKVRVTYPSNYDITKHNVEILPVNSSGTVNWTTNPQPIVTSPIPSNGEVTFNTLKVGDRFWVRITPPTGQQFMDDIVTVTDAYKSFLAVSDVGLGGTSTIFQYPKLEKQIGNITVGDTLFNQLDSYNLFAKVVGIETSTNTTIPSSTSENPKLLSGPISTFNQGNFNSYYQIQTQNSVLDMAYAWGGDLDFSHSSNPTLSGVPQFAPKGISNVLVSTLNTNLEEVRLGLTSKFENGKVVITTNLTKSDLAGLQLILGFDSSKIELENIVFDSGNTVTNFSTVKTDRLTFGSIDQLGSGRIKVGTPYKLIFKPKVVLTNTSGLFYTILSDAVDNKGNKIKLIVE